jgi:hypothetical protein
MGHMPSPPLNPRITTAVWKAGQTQPTDLPHKDVRVDRNPVYRDKASVKVQGGETGSKDEFIPQYNNYCDKDNRVFAGCDELNQQISNEVIESMKGFQVCQENDTIYRVLGNECEDDVDNEEDNTAGEDFPCLEINYALAQTAQVVQNSGMQTDKQEHRSLNTEQLCAKIWKIDGLVPAQKNQLYEVLSKYQPYLTSKPGRCNKFQYRFTVEGNLPSSASTRPIPFALRNKVKEQIQEMIEDGILEESYSDFVNPLTIVMRPNKSIHVCVDARKVNKQMVANKATSLPVRELLQKFYGSRYISSIDLSKAFLQVPLEESSRKYTAFRFENQVYQFTVIPYGFKNSLSGFIRALNHVLEDKVVKEYVVVYVDDIIIQFAAL